MHALVILRTLGGIDLKNVRRDPLLLWLTVLAVALVLAFRWGVAGLTRLLDERTGFDLTPYDPLILSFLALTMPAIAGAIVGFLLLDQRDDGTLHALQVTPLTLRSYLTYRAAAPMALSLFLTVMALWLSGLMRAGPTALVLDAVVAAPLGPIYALFLAGFAANKVQGFALSKASGVLSWPAIFAWFMPWPWQLVCGVVPHYWIAKVVWVTEAEGNPWPYFAAALISQTLLLWLLARRFDEVATR